MPVVAPARTAPIVDSARQVLLLSAGAVLVLVAIAVIALVVVSRELRAAHTSQDQARHTRRVLDYVDDVLQHLKDAETGARGYVITGTEEFLDPYYGAQGALDREIATLRGLVSDAESQELATELATLGQEQIRFLTRMVELRATEGQTAAVRLAQTGEGKRRMDRIRELVAGIDARERALLDERVTAFRARSLRSERAARVSLTAAVLLMLAAGGLLVWHTRRRLGAEEKASEALSLLRSTLNTVTEGVGVFNSEHRLIAWNSRYVELRGLNPQQVHRGMHVRDIIEQGAWLSNPRQQTRPDAVALAASVLDTGRDMDEEIERADGAVMQVRGRAMPDGNYTVTYTDVTPLKLSEAAFRDQATRLASILDNVVDAIVTINESGSIESWSKGAERLFGYSTEEVLRRNVCILMPEPHASAHDGYIRSYVHTGEARIIGTRRELEGLHKDGHRIPVELSVSEMRIGARRLFVGVLRDISARQEIERLKSGFVSTVSHELRTPLTSISGSLGLLAGGLAGALPATAARLIDIARLNCERLVRLINDILDLEKAEAGRLAFRLESQPLKAIVQQAIDANRAYAQTFGATIELDAASEDAHVLVDRDRLIQVLTNVLSNAAKFSPRGGVIDVSIRTERDSVRVCVRDQGPGIAPEFRDRIFKRFAQADSSDSRAKGGTGLGLSIAKAIIERLGGSISFNSVEQQGTTFCVTLPVRREPSATKPNPLSARPSPRVLICEDDPDVAHILSDIVGREGVRAETVASASEARTALEGGGYDVAIVDLHLPDADGLELITQLRSREATRSLPVIVVTARSRSPSDTNLIGALHLADWLQKPIDPQRLLDAIGNALNPLAGRRPRILHVEDDVSLTHLVHELLAPEADVFAAHSLADARGRLESGQFDLVILDMALGDGSGLDVLPLPAPQGRLAPPVILYSATEPTRELSSRVQAALVKSRDSVESLLAAVRTLADKRGG